MKKHNFNAGPSILADEVIVVGDGELRHRGSPREILPQILSDTLGGCPVLTKEGAAV